MSADVVVIIPARGGSERIPRKNLREFNGHPMLWWPIQTALAAEGVSRVVVSTDDSEITAIALGCGAEVPFVRPSDLADSHAGTAPVIRHAIGELGLGDDTVVVCLYPTSTLPTDLVQAALGVSRDHPDHFTVGVGTHRSPLGRALALRPDSLMALVEPQNLLTRTQDLPTHYFDAGKFYGAKAAIWMKSETMMALPFVPLFLPQWATTDIDEPGDWEIAEALHRAFVLNGPQ